MGTQKKLSLKSGRPPTAKNTPPNLSSKATQKTIVTFHNLNKALAKAQTENDEPTITTLKAQFTQLGGLQAYQAASIQGQSSARGGDSSIQLLKWLPHNLPKMRMLEVGALSTQNESSKSGLFDPIVRIDLHSQAPGILQQDFMERPVPSGEEEERFDVISLSLVLNFVPDAKQRGNMLQHTTRFLQKRDALGDFAGLLFLVLPAPCVVNSRYFNDERLMLIMASLGYVMLQRKQTSKLVYYLWQLRDAPAARKEQRFGKVKVRDGAAMNNFCVVLEPEV
ncbi:hypothetical protein M409DRAFT_60448 [Zasmidium cellare ATCC 36951]|uniref:25S rRNA adenine-N(1) methyltransferase n=1 Tax=Zasmidium cellare ATCC 36951 TaxID=1080233 RepID=A0A6A6BZ24_ZASCE|nr:uncharacterized protein M409DRAFT_60448 [Zasmidium cellare ATCC 36951]KAF2159853.1 hypothetical protein M409DRAFT_60448 [Zasmidium cellare ATCC 36951]